MIPLNATYFRRNETSKASETGVKQALEVAVTLKKARDEGVDVPKAPVDLILTLDPRQGLRKAVKKRDRIGGRLFSLHP